MSNIGNPDLIENQMTLTKRCNRLIVDMAKEGEAYARAEYAYQVQKNMTAYRLQEEGVTSTMMNNIIKGEAEVAELMLKRDLAKAKYEAIKEAINIVKLQMRMTDSQINREWGRNE